MHCVRVLGPPHIQGAVVALHVARRVLFSSCDSGLVYMWDAETFQLLYAFSPSDHPFQWPAERPMPTALQPGDARSPHAVWKRPRAAADGTPHTIMVRTPGVLQGRAGDGPELRAVPQAFTSSAAQLWLASTDRSVKVRSPCVAVLRHGSFRWQMCRVHNPAHRWSQSASKQLVKHLSVRDSALRQQRCEWSCVLLHCAHRCLQSARGARGGARYRGPARPRSRASCRRGARWYAAASSAACTRVTQLRVPALDPGVRYVLEKAGAMEYSEAFVRQSVDLHSLALLSDEDFEKARALRPRWSRVAHWCAQMGLPLGPRRKIGSVLQLLHTLLRRDEGDVVDALREFVA